MTGKDLIQRAERAEQALRGHDMFSEISERVVSIAYVFQDEYNTLLSVMLANGRCEHFNAALVLRNPEVTITEIASTCPALTCKVCKLTFYQLEDAQSHTCQ